MYLASKETNLRFLVRFSSKSKLIQEIIKKYYLNKR